MKYLILIMSLVFVQCNSDRSEQIEHRTLGKQSIPSTATSSDMMAEDEPKIIENNDQQPLDDIMIIRNGNMDFTVDDIQVAKARMDSLVKSSNGYYESEQYHDYGNRNNYSLKIRVPNKQFDHLVKSIESIDGELTNKSISAKDVSEEYLDLNIRLENKLAYVNQYKEILKKAKTIKEILEVQERIRRIETEIDSHKGRLKYLSNQVSFSTLKIELTKKITILRTGNKFSDRITKAFGNGIKVAQGVIIGLVSLWPIILLIILVFIFRGRLFSRFRKS